MTPTPRSNAEILEKTWKTEERWQGIKRNYSADDVVQLRGRGAVLLEAIGEILRFMQALAEDESIAIDAAVAASEARTGFRNTALAHYMKSFGIIEHDVDRVLGVYFHHCAIAMTCRQLAMAGRWLAHGGRNPVTGLSIMSRERARRINALMLTCGHYDGSGEFAFRVGLPGKSGVGGGILAIVPGVASVAVWSPGLDATGNSHLGRIALQQLSAAMGWSIFG